SSRRRHTRSKRDWSSDVCSSDLGDHESAADYMAGRLGISQVYADCLPEDKLKRIEEYQKAGKKICMIGDGINDAPALKKAFVGRSEERRVGKERSSVVGEAQ